LISFNQITANFQSSLQAADNLPSACADKFRYFISKEDRLLRHAAACQQRGSRHHATGLAEMLWSKQYFGFDVVPLSLAQSGWLISL